MSIKQHFARWKETEAAKLRPMTAKQRAGYILHYYRFWFIGLAMLLLVGFYIGDAVIQSHKEILLQGFFTNDEYNLFPAERIEKDTPPPRPSPASSASCLTTPSILIWGARPASTPPPATAS